MGLLKELNCIRHKSIEVDLKSRTEMWVVDYLQRKTSGVQGAGLPGWKPPQKRVFLVRLQEGTQGVSR